MEDEFVEPELEGESTSESEAKSAISADLIRGHINTIILRTLYERDKYGYEIIEEIEAKSHGQYSLKQPTLYSALKRLESQGYINAYWKTDEVSQGGRRKYYTLTDSGREITERNQTEWEYSRTVIDNLISDRNFDFSQPAPTAVDFKILKSSTTRVPTAKSEGSEREVDYDEPDTAQVVEIKREEATPVVVTEAEPDAAPDNSLNTTPNTTQEFAQDTAPTSDIVYVEPAPVQTEQAPAAEQSVTEDSNRITEEERKVLHENYMRLISEPVAEEKADPNETPYAANMDTEKLIFNNRSEPERDYRNLVNNLFSNTYRRETAAPAPQPQPQPQPEPEKESAPAQRITIDTVRIDDATVKAKHDGLSVGTSEYTVSGTRRKKYNRGNVMFMCALIVGVLMLLEFALCLIFQKELGINLAYPFVIFALALAEVLIFGILNYTDIGKSSHKPSPHKYLTVCAIITVIIVLIIFVTSLILNVNFASAEDIMAKIVIPCIVALNIPIFATLFYLFNKQY